jgi:hypothetical protein
MEANGIYGQISCGKPDNVVRVMYENFLSLGLLVKGGMCHKKI